GSGHVDLDTPKYCTFGKVVEGMDVVDKIRAVETKPEPRIGGEPAPVQPVIIKTARLVGQCDRDKISSLSKAVGKPPPPPAWKKKMDELRGCYQATQGAQAALNSAPADKKEAAQKEVDRLTAQQKAVEAEVYRVAAEDAARDLQEYLPKAEKETGKKFE